jgi:hypothetical protein
MDNIRNMEHTYLLKSCHYKEKHEKYLFGLDKIYREKIKENENAIFNVFNLKQKDYSLLEINDGSFFFGKNNEPLSVFVFNYEDGTFVDIKLTVFSNDINLFENIEYEIYENSHCIIKDILGYQLDLVDFNFKIERGSFSFSPTNDKKYRYLCSYKTRFEFLNENNEKLDRFYLFLGLLFQKELNMKLTQRLYSEIKKENFFGKQDSSYQHRFSNRKRYSFDCIFNKDNFFYNRLLHLKNGNMLEFVDGKLTEEAKTLFELNFKG